MVSILLAAFWAAQGQAAPDDRLAAILERVSEEAEVFALTAPKAIGEETLRQRVVKAPPRFRPRVGKSALGPPPVRYQTREIVSEYAFSSLKESPGWLYEFRQVISVDGRRIRSREKARKELASRVRADDDILKKKALREFENHGLVGAATDFGQSLLLFSRRQLGNYSFRLAGAGRIGAERVLLIGYRQTQGHSAITIFHGDTASRPGLEGEISVRESDFLPLRVTLQVSNQEDGQPVRHQATVDYSYGAQGLLLPASVLYTKHVGPRLVAENLYTYATFRMFSVDAQIKFTPEEPPPR